MTHTYLSTFIKKTCCFACLSILSSFNLAGQIIQYSRQSVIINFPDATQLLSNIAGYHHLVCLTYKKKPVVHIFDQQLQLKSSVEIPFKLPEYSETRLLAFSRHYYMYIQMRKTGRYELWRIDEKGNATPLTTAFEKLIETEFPKSQANFQLVNNNDQLYVISHTYYNRLEKVETTVVNADEMMNVLTRQKALYDFDAATEVLHQIMLVNKGELIVMKNSKRFQQNNKLELVKVGLDSGLVVTTTFNSSGNYYSEPSFSYNAADSSVTVYSMIRDVYSGRTQRVVLICQLDNGLQEKMPLTLLKSQFTNNPLASFLLVDGKQPLWIGYMNRSPRLFSTYSRPNTFNSTEERINMLMLNNQYDRYYRDSYEQSSAIKFTLLNSQLKPAADSVVFNSKSSYGIQPQQYAKFAINTKSYLLFNQLFSSNRRGILMVHGNDEKRIELTDIRVNDRYDYLLSQLQVLPGKAVLLPYTHRREAGLIKLTLE